MAALFFTFYESDSFCKEPHRPHQRRVFIRISLQDFIGRDESGEGAIGFGECVFGERIIGLHDATTQDYDIWFEYNTEIPDGSLQFKTDFPDECSGVWIFFCPFFVEIIKILESQCLGAVMQCGAGPEIFKAASVTAVARLWWIEWISVRIR